MRRLGYERYGAQGGDVGAGVAGDAGRARRRARRRHPRQRGPLATVPVRTAGIELDGLIRRPIGAARRAVQRAFAADGLGLPARCSRTRPQTLGYALTDSPVGQLAWIVEKFEEWTDPAAALPEDAVDRDQLLTNVSIYWFTGTGASSANASTRACRPTRDRAAATQPVPRTAAGVRGVRRRLDDPRARSTRTPVVHWTEFDRGGHFAAMEDAGPARRRRAHVLPRLPAERVAEDQPKDQPKPHQGASDELAMCSHRQTHPSRARDRPHGARHDRVRRVRPAAPWDPSAVAVNHEPGNTFLLRPGQILAGPGDAPDVAARADRLARASAAVQPRRVHAHAAQTSAIPPREVLDAIARVRKATAAARRARPGRPQLRLRRRGRPPAARSASSASRASRAAPAPACAWPPLPDALPRARPGRRRQGRQDRRARHGHVRPRVAQERPARARQRRHLGRRARRLRRRRVRSRHVHRRPDPAGRAGAPPSTPRRCSTRTASATT